MAPFAKIVNSCKPLAILAKSSILVVWLGFEYTSEVYQFFAMLVNENVSKIGKILWIAGDNGRTIRHVLTRV